jgi:hypothetical protein
MSEEAMMTSYMDNRHSAPIAGFHCCTYAQYESLHATGPHVLLFVWL